MMYQMNRAIRQPRIFDDPFFRSVMGMEPQRRPQGMRVDVRNAQDAYILEAELPGVKLEDITLTSQDDVLTIAAERKPAPDQEGMVMRERRWGRVERRFSLEGIDQAGITAACAEGILTVTLPKEKPEGAKALRHIPINAPIAAADVTIALPEAEETAVAESIEA